MASFIPAYRVTADHEGGYVNDVNDRGGETYAGVARNYHPDWSGWSLIDQIPNKKRFDVFPALKKHVKEFYREKFWDRFRLGEIKNQSIATLIYDWRVNSGKAIQEVQKVLIWMGQPIVADGKIGSQTIKAINSVDSVELHKNIVAARVQYYNALVSSGHLHPSFLDGLTARAESFSVGKYQRV